MIRSVEFTARLHPLEKAGRRTYPYEDIDRDPPKMPVDTFWQFRNEDGEVAITSPILFAVDPACAVRKQLSMPHMQPLVDVIGQVVPMIGLYFRRLGTGSWCVSWHVQVSEAKKVVVPPLEAPGVFKGQRHAYKILPASSFGLDIAIDPEELEWAINHCQTKAMELAGLVKEYSPRAALAINNFDPVPIIQEIQNLNFCKTL